MNPSTIERAAYLAAHRIIQADLSNPQFACPGTRRSRTIDAIAGIIKGVMEAEPAPVVWIEEPFTQEDYDDVLRAARVARGTR